MMKTEELHDILYGILCAIDDACKKEHVPYFLGGGTMLGAVRHHGFIPWDDDADVCIWKKDYPAMRDALRKHLPSHYQLVEPLDLSPYFYDFVPRVQDTRYYWHEPSDTDKKYNNLQNHICVDIFCVANSADSSFAAGLYTLQHEIIYGMAMGHRVEYDSSKYTLLQKMQAGFLSTVGKTFSMDKIVAWHDKLSDRYDKKDRKYCTVINDLPKYLGLRYESSWFKGTVDMPFRDRTLPVQAGYHEKMTLQYGDYMTPPSDRSEYVSHMDCE